MLLLTFPKLDKRDVYTFAKFVAMPPVALSESCRKQ